MDSEANFITCMDSEANFKICMYYCTDFRNREGGGFSKVSRVLYETLRDLALFSDFHPVPSCKFYGVTRSYSSNPFLCACAYAYLLLKEASNLGTVTV